MLQSRVQVSETRFLAYACRRTEIPANREKSREFRRFSRFLSKSVSKTSVNTAICAMSSLRDTSMLPRKLGWEAHGKQGRDFSGRPIFDICDRRAGRRSLI